MAETTGLIQEVTIAGVATSLPTSCFVIGPTPTNVEAFLITTSSSDTPQTAAFKSSMIDALSTAHLSRQEVTVRHGDNSPYIEGIVFQPS